MRTKSPAIAAALSLLAAVSFSQSTLQDLVQPARDATHKLAGSLMPALSEALKEGGPLQAIAVCRDRAPSIAAQVGRESGMEVRRTALKVRNPANRPDAWETAVLKDFAERLKKGEDPAAMERAEIVSAEGRQVFRYMKPITTGDPCLKCHGPQVDPVLVSKIRELYPNDQAVGFKKGELRGAFTVKRTL